MERERSRSRVLGLSTVLLLAACKWQPNTETPVPVSSRAPNAPAAIEIEGDSAIHATRVDLWSHAEDRRKSARISLHADELRWLSTPQHARQAFMVSSETGFASWGVETSIAEIPVGWHSGRQRAGEEAIYIVSGAGKAIVDGLAYDFDIGTTLAIPYGAERQLFNTGRDTVRLVSATAYPLERHLGIYRIEQLAIAGTTDPLPRVSASDDGFDARGRRIRLHWEEAQFRDGRVGLRSKLWARLRGGVDLAQRTLKKRNVTQGRSARLATGLGHHSAWIRLMGRGTVNGFANRLVTMSGVLIDEPGAQSGNHAHMEAVLFVLQGEGHTVIDGVEIPWRAGSSLHIQGPQTQHQHFNTGSETAYLLRIASGIRPRVEDAVVDVFPYLWFEAQGQEESEPHSGR